MDCCSNDSSCEIQQKDGICPKCFQAGKRVQKITLLHLLRNKYLKEVAGTQYYFCATQSCDVVYFSNETGQSFSKNQVRIRIGVKEIEHPRHVCYCFDYTEQNILEEIERTGDSSAAADISIKIKDKLCACEIKNPAGRCCLGQVRALIKESVLNFESTNSLVRR